MINELKGKGDKKLHSNIHSKHSDLLTATIKHKKCTIYGMDKYYFILILSLFSECIDQLYKIFDVFFNLLV